MATKPAKPASDSRRNRPAAARVVESLVPALERGLAVLELLAARRIGLRAIDIAQELRVPKNSLSRVLQTLVDRGYLDRDDTNKTFMLTRKLLAMGSTTVCESHLLEESLPIMRQLRDATAELIMLHAPLDSREGVVLNAMPSRHQIRLTVDPGTHFDYYNTAPGKVALAWLPPSESERILVETRWVKCTDRTIVDLASLREEIDGVRKCGYALDRGECVEGVHCVSAPIFDRFRSFVAALTLTGPSTRLSIAKLRDLAPTVIAHADAVSRRLGHEAGGSSHCMTT
jgi:DNA-binding IclR family transcriptional regulator